MILSLIFWSLAAICNAIMDVSNHHYSISIFREFNPMWWNGEISWKNKYIEGDPKFGFRKLFPNRKYPICKINYPVQLTDAWHLFKSLMIVLLAISVVTYEGYFDNILITITLYGIVWNLTFNTFYNHILKSNELHIS